MAGLGIAVEHHEQASCESVGGSFAVACVPSATHELAQRLEPCCPAYTLHAAPSLGQYLHLWHLASPVLQTGLPSGEPLLSSSRAHDRQCFMSRCLPAWPTHMSHDVGRLNSMGASCVIGSFPAQVLNLANTQIKGNIPVEFSSLTRLNVRKPKHACALHACLPQPHV